MDERTEYGSGTQNALQGLLSNPALLQALGGLMGGAQQSAPAKTADTKEGATAAETADASADTQVLSDGISRVLSDPDMMAKLPQVMELIKPMLASNSNAQDAVPAHAGGAFSKDVRCRNDLLLALKPFLSRERAAAVDAILRLSHLGNVLQTLK